MRNGFAFVIPAAALLCTALFPTTALAQSQSPAEQECLWKVPATLEVPKGLYQPSPQYSIDSRGTVTGQQLRITILDVAAGLEHQTKIPLHPSVAIDWQTDGFTLTDSLGTTRFRSLSDLQQVGRFLHPDVWSVGTEQVETEGNSVFYSTAKLKVVWTMEHLTIREITLPGGQKVRAKGTNQMHLRLALKRRSKLPSEKTQSALLLGEPPMPPCEDRGKGWRCTRAKVFKTYPKAETCVGFVDMKRPERTPLPAKKPAEGTP